MTTEFLNILARPEHVDAAQVVIQYHGILTLADQISHYKIANIDQSPKLAHSSQIVFASNDVSKP